VISIAVIYYGVTRLPDSIKDVAQCSVHSLASYSIHLLDTAQQRLN